MDSSSEHRVFVNDENFLRQKMDLTKYRNVFGEPGKGVHSARIFGLALFDLALTVVGAYFVSKWVNVNPILAFIGLIFIGIGIHGFFGVNTKLNQWLGISKEVWGKKNDLF